MGWIHFDPIHVDAVVYNDHLEGSVWGENVGWIRLGTYEAGGSHSYANDAGNTYGVNNDGSGNLSGYAWGTNVGWINFDPANGGVTAYSDHLEGYAWAENIGWIRMGTHTGGGAHTYGNTGPSDYGVNVAPDGTLSGYAWGTNVGWLNLNPTPGGGATVYSDHLEGTVGGGSVGRGRPGTAPADSPRRPDPPGGQAGTARGRPRAPGPRPADGAAPAGPGGP